MNPKVLSLLLGVITPLEMITMAAHLAKKRRWTKDQRAMMGAIFLDFQEKEAK